MCVCVFAYNSVHLKNCIHTYTHHQHHHHRKILNMSKTTKYLHVQSLLLLGSSEIKKKIDFVSVSLLFHIFFTPLNIYYLKIYSQWCLNNWFLSVVIDEHFINRLFLIWMIIQVIYGLFIYEPQKNMHLKFWKVKNAF